MIPKVIYLSIWCWILILIINSSQVIEPTMSKSSWRSSPIGLLIVEKMNVSDPLQIISLYKNVSDLLKIISCAINMFSIKVIISPKTKFTQ